eukprot:6490325-Amphidinium_carterae.2
MEVTRLDMVNMVTPEVLVALATPTPHSAKIRCTIATQTPELYEQITELSRVIKSQGTFEEKEEQKNKRVEVLGMGNSSANVTVNLEAGDELTIAVKKPRAV